MSDKTDRLRAVWAGFPVLVLVSLARGDVAVTAWSLVSEARDGGGAQVQLVESVVSTPTFDLVRTATDAGSTAVNTYDFDLLGDFTTLAFDFDHVRSGALGSIARGVANGPASLLFSVSAGADLLYSLDGSYELTGNQRIEMFVSLRDLTAATTLLSSFQRSVATENQLLVVGGVDGDSENSLGGSLNGTLTAGHDYQLIYDFFVHANSSGDSGASGNGSLALRIQPINASEVLKNATLDLAGEVATLGLELFNGPNDNANRGRRNALANRAADAADLIATGDVPGAIDKLKSLLKKVDGQNSPRDWMELGSVEREDLAIEVQLLMDKLALLF